MGIDNYSSDRTEWFGRAVSGYAGTAFCGVTSAVSWYNYEKGVEQCETYSDLREKILESEIRSDISIAPDSNSGGDRSYISDSVDVQNGSETLVDSLRQFASSVDVELSQDIDYTALFEIEKELATGSPDEWVVLGTVSGVFCIGLGVASELTRREGMNVAKEEALSVFERYAWDNNYDKDRFAERIVRDVDPSICELARFYFTTSESQSAAVSIGAQEYLRRKAEM